MKLEVIELSKKFNSKLAVDNMSIELSNGVYGLLGENGAGKSTFMRLLCDIQKPSSGVIKLNGQSISKMGERYRDLIGYLPQDFPYYQNFNPFDYMMYISALKGLGQAEARKKSVELLELVGLSSKNKTKIKTLSGGMKQRIGIAQAMLNNPKILILDEPTTGLDPKERVSFRNLISSFYREKIVILSTHIVSDIEFIADEIIIMKEGRVLQFGRTESIIGEVESLVWECNIESTEVEKYKERLNIINIQNIENNRSVIRVISKGRPIQSAMHIEPSLEDLYMYYFREANL